MLLIGLPEETRVVEPRSEHAFVSMTNDAPRIAVGVQHCQKMRQQLAACVLDREVLLMIAHHRYQDFLRQFQKLLIKTSQDCRRKFGQVDDRVEEAFIFPPARTRNRASGSVECFANLLLALSPVADYLSLGQCVRVSI